MFKLCKARGGGERRPVPQAKIILSCCSLVDAPAETVGMKEARGPCGLVAQGVLPGVSANCFRTSFSRPTAGPSQIALFLPVLLLGEHPLGCSAFTLASAVLVTGSRPRCEGGLCFPSAFQPRNLQAPEKDGDAWIPGQTAAIQTRSSNWHPGLLWQ